MNSRDVLSPDDERVRSELTRAIAERGHAPPLEQLAERVGCNVGTLERHLLRLADTHSLLLHPGTTRPWVVHPFALAPGSCWVRTPRHGYWANCIYCAFGIAAALDCNATITTRYGGEEEVARYDVRRGHGVTPTSTDVFHLSIPPARWWDNVIFACSSFQPFRSESNVTQWCDAHTMPRGAIMSLDNLWSFAGDWYGSYLTRPWRKRTPDEVQAIFTKHGLTSSFWGVT